MFDIIIKKSKVYQDLETINKFMSDDIAMSKQLIDELSNERTKLSLELDTSTTDLIKLTESNNELKKELATLNSAGGVLMGEGNSSVVFEFDKELAVTVKSRINSDIVMTLIDKGYITSEFAEDEASIQFAFVLMANEASEQIIIGVNNDED